MDSEPGILWASEWAEVAVVHATGLSTFFGIDESYEAPRREALERIFAGGSPHFVVYPHDESPPYYVSVYARRNEDDVDDVGVDIGTAWRQDRLPNLLELLLALEAWGPTKGLQCSASW